MAFLNKIMLIGNVGKNPETRTFQDGGKIVNITMATNKKYTNNNGQVINQTTWHNIVFRNKLADVVEQLVHYGDLIFVEGELLTRKYTDKNGTERVVYEVAATTMQILKQAPSGDASQQPAYQGQQTAAHQQSYNRVQQQQNDDNGLTDLPF